MKKGPTTCVFFCDERYFPGHKCNGQVYRLEITKDGEWEKGQEEMREESVPPSLQDEKQPLISLQALQGVNAFQTMRVTGRVGSQLIHILVDSGSTHNFLDATTAKRLRCELLKIPPLVVAVADGTQLECQTLCRGFAWTLIETGGMSEYITDPYIVSLGSCDMVLGV